MCVVHIAAQGQVREGLDYGVNCRLLIRNQGTLCFLRMRHEVFGEEFFFWETMDVEKKNNRMVKEEMDTKKENDGRKGNSR